MNKYIETIKMSSKAKINAGLIYLIPEILIEIFYLTVLIFFWSSLLSKENNTGIYVSQMLTYVFMGRILKEFLNIQSEATNWSYDGLFNSLFIRPMNVLLNISLQHIGKILPRFMVFSVPMILIGPIFKINVIPASPYFIISFILTVSLGFAVEYLFTCIIMALPNIRWGIICMRAALMAAFSGAFIPFNMLPFGLDKILIYQPFASLGGAFLSVYTGMSEPLDIILVQLFWNVVLWLLTIILFRKSREAIVSYGG